MDKKLIKLITFVISIFFYFKNKIIRKIYGRYNFNNYPKEIKIRINNYLKNKQCAIDNLIVDQKINSHREYLFFFKKENYTDEEEYELVHRFSWLNYQKPKKKNIDLIYTWISKYLNFNAINKKDLSWESYTVSERIINIIKFSKNNNLNFLKEFINFHVIFLLKKLEYFNSNTNNHILNNARAIIFASYYLEDRKLKEIGIKILKNDLKKFITKSGFLREGSVSYHLLVTTWLLEILEIFIINNKNELFNFFKSLVTKMLSNSFFFKQKNNFIFFGDNTPDISNNFLIQKIVNFKKNYPALKLRFNNILKKNKKFFEKIDEYFKFSNYNIVLYIKFLEKGLKNFPNHEHDENFHFNLLYKKIPLFIDLNRFSYQNNDGIHSNYHNSSFINKKGPLPINFKKLPFELCYSKYKIKYTSKFNFSKIKIKSDCYSNIFNKVFWERNFYIGKNNFIVKDSFKNLMNNDVRLYFHLNPYFIVKKKSMGEYLLYKRNIKFCSLRFSGTKSSINILNSNYSSSYGILVSTLTFEIHSKISKDFNNTLEVKFY